MSAISRTLLMGILLIGILLLMAQFQGFDTRNWEGLRLHVYKDSVGKATIGYGHNMTTAKSKLNCSKLGLDHDGLLAGRIRLTTDEANRLYELDREDAEKDAKSLIDNFDEHPPMVQQILVDLSFNMGKTVLSTFKQTIAAFEDKNYALASSRLKKSLWYKQVGQRSKAITEILSEM